MTSEIEWVNNLKVVGIAAVVLGHIANPANEFIYSWHMPLFFIISGLFIKPDDLFKDFFITNFKRLMIPYFLFSFIGILAESIKISLLKRNSLDYLHEATGVFFWMDMPGLLNTYAFVLWFLPTLFIAKLIFILTNKYCNSKILQAIFYLLLLFTSKYINLPFAIDNAFSVVIFLFIGSCFLKLELSDKLIYAAIATLVLIYYFVGVPPLDVANKNYSNMVLNIMWALTVFYILYSVFSKISINIHVWKIWSASTMYIFIVHPYTNNIAHLIVEQTLPGNWVVKFITSLIFIQALILIKSKFDSKGIFRYV